MMQGLPLTVTGFLGDDPELRTTPGGAPVTNFVIAHTPRRWDREAGEYADGTTMWVRVTAWRALAENVCQSLSKGSPAFATGYLYCREFEDREGNNRVSWELNAEHAGVNLSYATAQVQRTAPQGQAQQQQASGDGGQGGFNPTTQGFPSAQQQQSPQPQARSQGAGWDQPGASGPAPY